MAEVAAAVEGVEGQLDANNASLGYGAHEKNRIQVSNTKKPLFFYVNLAKRYMQQHDEVELSALGMAIATVVTVAEILKNNGLAVERTKLEMGRAILSSCGWINKLITSVNSWKLTKEGYDFCPGNVIARAVIEWCDDAPPVNNFVSIGGPHAGILPYLFARFLLPASLIVINDIATYFFGFFFGRTPLIKFSPKKTWEGFIGASVMTVISGFVVAYLMGSSEWLTCPRKDLSTGWLHCDPGPLFKAKFYSLAWLPSWAPWPGREVTIMPMQLHAMVLGLFASSIAPFGGFFAGGFKRAFKIKVEVSQLGIWVEYWWGSR